MVRSAPVPGAGLTAPARKVLVAGATGLVGRALLDQLLAGPDPASDIHALRRHTGGGPDPVIDPRLHWHAVDLAALPALPAVDEVYIALGTTLRQAGSREAFRAIDFDAVLAVARAARLAGAQRLGVVSAMGARRDSVVFYNRVKGEMEAAVAALGYPSVTFAQPSLLVGDRSALGQPPRAGEQWGQRLLGPLSALIPRSLRPIAAAAVAHALLEAVKAGAPGVTRLGSGQMQS